MGKKKLWCRCRQQSSNVALQLQRLVYGLRVQSSGPVAPDQFAHSFRRDANSFGDDVLRFVARTTPLSCTTMEQNLDIQELVSFFFEVIKPYQNVAIVSLYSSLTNIEWIWWSTLFIVPPASVSVEPLGALGWRSSAYFEVARSIAQNWSSCTA